MDGVFLHGTPVYHFWTSPTPAIMLQDFYGITFRIWAFYEILQNFYRIPNRKQWQHPINNQGGLIVGGLKMLYRLKLIFPTPSQAFRFVVNLNYLKQNAIDVTIFRVFKYKQISGKDNFFCEHFTVDPQKLWLISHLH